MSKVKKGMVLIVLLVQYILFTSDVLVQSIAINEFDLNTAEENTSSSYSLDSTAGIISYG